MFSSSSQRHHWMYQNENLIQEMRQKANAKFIERHKDEVASDVQHLSPEEEAEIVHYFATKLGEFCNKFRPPMPRYVKGTAFHYFKRFYLNNSPMDYHPKEILVTAVYLASKVEEFNVSINQFVSNVQGNQERATSIILNNELLLMQELQFHLTIHNPFRAVEGLLIDIKTRCSMIENVDSFRPDIDSFLDQVFLCDAPLIFAPSQIALAAIIHAASRQKQNLDSYVTELLFGGQGMEVVKNIIDSVRKIRIVNRGCENRFLNLVSPPCRRAPYLCKSNVCSFQIRVLVKNLPEPTKNIKVLCDRLELCRNQQNNPDSSAYKRKLEEELVDEEDLPLGKHARLEVPDGGHIEASLGLRTLSPQA